MIYDAKHVLALAVIAVLLVVYVAELRRRVMK